MRDENRRLPMIPSWVNYDTGMPVCKECGRPKAHPQYLICRWWECPWSAHEGLPGW